ncbi:hypothetical protein LY90DRAFT_675619 [Neocallimastix californiae]|uniref:G-protein coupled receptors family 3 profile domain-containing protein n=1 Tax=Neocallimastix californiae TaxID=1754190 RepID=A0A1Y2AKU9_9FUNG|nr:hypothetical protein LY90DRAFT_675619 [Neocallimastix californiae]|eukprot:ORY23171.1 hypothetical protein LY90DRAFT_675619 [Neocallimastix californiae]
MKCLISPIIALLYIFLYASIKVNTYNPEKINVLISKPDIEEPESYLKRINSFVQQYVDKKRHENNKSITIPTLDIEFSYCDPVKTDGDSLLWTYNYYDLKRYVDLEFARNLNCTIRELKKQGDDSKFDLVVIQDRILYSDDTYIRNAIIEGSFYIRHFYDYLLTLDESEISNYTKHHDKELIKRARNPEKGLLGLPYEIDFNNLYYYDEAEYLKDIFLSGILSIALEDGSELTDLFFEYIRSQFGEPDPEKNFEYLNNFIQDKSKIINFYKSFRDYVIKFTGKDIESTLSTTHRQAFQSFVRKDKKLFKGKASYYSFLKDKIVYPFSMVNLSNNYGIVDGKYLSIVAYSEKYKKYSSDVMNYVLLLTSEDFQLARAASFGSIPTFNLKSKEFLNPINNETETPNANAENENDVTKNDEIIKFDNTDDHTTNIYSYCINNPDICKVYNNTKPVEIKKIFYKNKYSAGYLEIRITLPEILKQLLIEGDSNLIFERIPNYFDKGVLVEIQNKHSYKEILTFFLFTGINLVVVLILLFTMVKVYKNRKHPFLKAISPLFSNLTLLGLILKCLFPYYFFIVDSKLSCQMNFALNFFFSNLIFLPMLAIIFRIYYIYTNVSNVNFGKKLNDKRILIILSIILILEFIITFLISFAGNYDFSTYGVFLPYRSIWCFFTDYVTYMIIITFYCTILFFCMIIMLIKIHKISKKYGDIKFIFFIVILLFSTSIFDGSIYLLNGTDSFFFVLFIVYLICCVLSTYLLVGYRLNFIKNHPIKNGSYNGNSVNDDYFDNAINLVNFIPLIKDKNSINGFSFKSSNGKSKYDNKNNGTFYIIPEEEDPIDRNPNNYFFNRTLKMLNQK